MYFFCVDRVGRVAVRVSGDLTAEGTEKAEKNVRRRHWTIWGTRMET